MDLDSQDPTSSSSSSQVEPRILLAASSSLTPISRYVPPVAAEVVFPTPAVIRTPLVSSLSIRFRPGGLADHPQLEPTSSYKSLCIDFDSPAAEARFQLLILAWIFPFFSSLLQKIRANTETHT